MKNINITDFRFFKKGYGQWNVTFESRKTHKIYKCYTTDSQLIDATQHCENPKIKDLNQLKRICKQKYK